MLPGHRVRACHRLIRERQVKIGDAVLLAQLQATAGVPEGRLWALEHGVHAGDLPLASNQIDRLADLTPMEP
jgi:hypothetical protein